MVGRVINSVHQQPNAGEGLGGINLVITQQEGVQIGVLARVQVENPSEELLGDITVAVVRRSIRSISSTPKEAPRSSICLASVALVGFPWARPLSDSCCMFCA